MRWLFVPVMQGKPWNGDTPDQDSLGGSESAVIYTARALAELGESVYVMSHGVDAVSIYGKVTYVPQWALQSFSAQNWDVVVNSRWNDLFALYPFPNARQRLFWLHDMPGGGNPQNAHHYVCVSKYQAVAWGFRPVPLFDSLFDNCTVIPNGYDPDCFYPNNEGYDKRDLNKVLWLSNPDRGLPYACEMFQQIRKRWPDLELHVYGRSSIYGWGDEAEAPFMPLLRHRGNVFLHESVPRKELGRVLRGAWAVFYPTFWPETHCMAALEAQACGTPFIGSPLAALNETVVGGVLTYDFLNAFSQLRNAGRWKKLHELGIEHSQGQTWADRGRAWLELANGRLQQ